MQHWIVATLTGTILGLVLYGCVRLRMHVAPRLRIRFGDWARHVYWGLTIFAMVGFANLALLALRSYLNQYPALTETLPLEMWFALLALAIGLTLVFSRVRRND